MKDKKILNPLIIFFFFLASSNQAFSQGLWKLGTAATLPAHHYEIGFYQPARAGLTDQLELAANPPFFLVYPELSLKKQWWERVIMIATRHKISYPTQALKIAQAYSLDDWLPGDINIPHMAILDNSLLISREFKMCRCCPYVYLVTMEIGMQTGLPAPADSLPLSARPLLHHRSIPLNGHYLWKAGFDMEGQMAPKFNFSADVDYYRDFASGIQAIEHMGAVIWKVKPNMAVFGGYKLVYQPAQNVKTFSIYPVIDFKLSFATIQKPKSGLFGF
jgi:hypothetical protein